MNKGSYVFSQLVKALDEFVFLRIVKKYDGDKYVKHFSCWNQLLTLMFGQLTGKESLRRFIVASTPFKNKFYGLGLGKNLNVMGCHMEKDSLILFIILLCLMG